MEDIILIKPRINKTDKFVEISNCTIVKNENVIFSKYKLAGMKEALASLTCDYIVGLKYKSGKDIQLGLTEKMKKNEDVTHSIKRCLSEEVGLWVDRINPSSINKKRYTANICVLDVDQVHIYQGEILRQDLGEDQKNIHRRLALFLCGSKDSLVCLLSSNRIMNYCPEVYDIDCYALISTRKAREITSEIW